MVLTDWQPTLSAFGFIEPYQGVTLAVETMGRVSQLQFESGQEIVKDQLLLALNSSVEEAQLAAKEALLPAKERKMRRMLTLYQDNSIAEDQKDDAVAEYLALKSDVDALRASLAKRKVVAPFSGIVGLRKVFLGQYLNAGHEIVRLKDISTVRIRFSIAQTDLSRVTVTQKIEINVDAYPKASFIGQITAIEPTMDSQSGIVEIQADLPNTDKVLRSGMFARVNVLLPVLNQQIVIPQTAINFNLYGENLYVAEEETHAKKDKSKQWVARQRSITIQERRGHLALVAAGLKAGEKIATSGQIRLSNGSFIAPTESNALKSTEPLPRL